MFKNIFRLDSSLMQFMSHVTDCIFLSMFFFLGCLPVITVGTSIAAMYDAIFRGVREGEKNTWQRFLHVYRRNWRVGILPTIFFLLAAWGLTYGGIQAWNNAVYGNISWMMFSCLAMLVVTALGVLSVLFPMLSRFENGVGALMKNTVILSLANLPRTMMLGILNALAVIACYLWIFPLFFLPAMVSLLSSWLIEPMFAPYMPEEEEAPEGMEEACEEACEEAAE